MTDKRPFVLLIDDEPAIAKIIEFKIKQNNYAFKHIDNGREGLEGILELKPDLVILDVMLPSMNGFEILKRVRENEDPLINSTKIIMLTAKARVEDLKTGFDLNADDYMEKPFKPDELIFRVQKNIS